MKKSILVGLVALGLVACGAAPEAEVAADKAAEDAAVAAPAEAVEAPAADAAVVEAPAAEVVDFLVSNFISTDNPQSIWIGEIINSGEKNYQEWMKRQQSLSYLFKEQSTELFSEIKLEDALNCSKGHPPVLKKFLSGNISLETLVIYDIIFLFGNVFDKKLLDPVWETVSLKIKKYKPFIHIDVFSYKRILRDIIDE